jgi:hypothetical protein
MSYEKYIKYKTKYLNLKAKIHNIKIQSGGASTNKNNDSEFIHTLGSTPNSEIYSLQYNLAGGNQKKSESPESSESKSSETKSESPKSPESESPESPKSPESESQKSESSEPPSEPDQKGGKRKLKKKRNIFSDSENSDFDTTESSLLSFSSTENVSSSTD